MRPDYADGSTYELERARHAFRYDSYWGGDRYRHPSLTNLSAARLYETRTDAKTGEVSVSVRNTVASYLCPHPAESDESFTQRCHLASYVNLVAPLVDAYAEAVTANVRRETPGLEDYLVDVDGKGSTWGEHVEEVGRWDGVYGYLATVVDAPRGDEPPVSGLAERALRRGPRAIVVHPTAWAWVDMDDEGRLETFAYVESAYRDDTGAGVAQVMRVRARCWTLKGGADGRTPEWQVLEGLVATAQGQTVYSQRGAFTVAKDEAGRELRGPLPVVLGGELPVVFSYFKRVSDSRYPKGQSLVDDACDVARLIYNSLSWASEIHRKAGFPFLAIPLEKTGGGMDPQVKAAIGPDKGLPYSGSSGAPSWVQPSSESTRELREHCVFLFQLALRTAGLEVAADASAQVQSGEALRIRSRDFESRAARFARQLQRYEMQVLRLFGKFVGVTAEPKVEYPKRFVLPDPTQDLANALSVLKDVPVEIGADAKVAAVRQALGAALQITDDDMAKILDEVRRVMDEDARDFAGTRELTAAERDAKLAKIRPGEKPDGKAPPFLAKGDDAAPEDEGDEAA